MARIGSAPLPTITDDRALGAADIQRSLRFNYHDNAYLSRTVSTTSSRTTFTYSCWVKRTDISVSLGGVVLMGSNATSGTDHTAIFFDDDDTIGTRARNNGDGSTKTTAVFRDSTAWMHVMYVVDTPQVGLQTVRQKVYVNGVEQDVTILGSPHLVNSQLEINLDGTVMEIGAVWYNGSNATNRGAFYLAEVNFVDGQALDPSNFGFTDPMTSIWMPKRYEGTYGTNGFYLDFSDNSSTAALGIDRSPNGNDFTVNNFSVTAGEGNDSVLDTPTKNWATLNSLDGTSNVTFSEGNLKAVRSNAGFIASSNLVVTSGKWYMEMKYVSGTSNHQMSVGFGNPDRSYQRLVRGGDGELTPNTGNVAVTFADPDVLMLALDVDNGKWYIGKNGSYMLSGDPVNGTGFVHSGLSSSEGFKFIVINNTSDGGQTISANFGQQEFTYTPPTGFKAFNSSNIQTDPTINTILRPQKFFDTVTYTGNGSTGQSITSLDFQPDFIWFKSRTSANNNSVSDSVRGSTKVLYPDSTSSQVTDDSDKGVISYDTSGFTVGEPQNSSSHNINGQSLVAWTWKAGGNSNTFNIDGVGYATAAAAGLDGGAATPTGASVNTKAGFSILKYNGTANQSISHGLSRAPEFTIEKELSNSTAWTVTTTGIDDSLDYLYLNTSAAKANYTVDLPTSSLVDIGRNNECIMYMWHSVPGYSKIGNYEGNGNANGTYVHLGFKPAWIILKRTNASGNSWGIFDNKRSTSNPNTKSLFSNSTTTEYTTNTAIDFLANGFKLRSNATYTNHSGSTYLYMAFAETPEVTPFDTFPNAK